mmetsp:Transcript_19152/g.23595  ORF Transcript_19152/g.23595 Transcript_19152/m.23595 type:complete len:940 (-) Transcript_19152:628-3447(-)
MSQEVEPLVSAQEDDDFDATICDFCGGEPPMDSDQDIPCETPEQIAIAMKGLDSATVAERIEMYGTNEIPEKIIHWYNVLLKQLTSSMAIMIEITLVLAASIQSWSDFFIIAALLTINATIGFYEEWEALLKVESIKSSLAPMSVVKRDGEFTKIPTAELVPGDVIFLRGGDAVPADVDFLEGDSMAVDTAALTGEPFPRKIPDSKGHKRAMSGCMVVSGNSYLLVQRTGIYTEMGSATMLMQQSTKPTQSVFEKSIIQVCERVMFVAVLILIAIFIVEWFFRHENFITILTTCMAILIASVPVALPVVMQVTLALGAQEMAKQQAIVTHLTSMQEIASMNVLCSDKTGTLTTAKIQVFYDLIWTPPESGFDRDHILEWCAVASNPHAEDDPIDVAILRSFRDTFSQDYNERIKRYTVKKFVGFTPETKRTVVYASHPKHGDIKISKGLIDKILDTSADGGDEFKCINKAKVETRVRKIDSDFAHKGYKTLGVAAAIKDRSGSYSMQFVGVVPMLDPPRDDTKWVIGQIHACGIDVKMITGDHQNIAAETARLIGLGDQIIKRDILANLREGEDKDLLVKNAHGFAQVMPRDKNDVVRILQTLNYIVGMTGDGVNDAPALKQAHIGIAVEGATDAARNAADIVLTTDGLAPIFTAVLESRKIFQRVYSYVLYRISATIQIVLVLSLLIFIYFQPIKPLYIILLALFNDLTMITISYDNVIPSRSPEQPTINKLLRVSTVFGLLMTVESLIFYIFAENTTLISSKWNTHADYRESLIYLQISIAIESLIFITRTPDAPFFSSTPISSLILSVIFANVAITVLVTSGILGQPISIDDAIVTWVYDIIWFFLIDLLKIPITVSIENHFPKPSSNVGKRTAESEAAHKRPEDQDANTLDLSIVDLGYTYINDVRSFIFGDSFAYCRSQSNDNPANNRTSGNLV